MANEFWSFIPGKDMLSSGNQWLDVILVIMIVVVAGAIIGAIIWWINERKKWNLKVTFILPRAVQQLNDNRVLTLEDIRGSIFTEWGKGMYNLKRGCVFLKRKGKKKAVMKPFNINKYLQDNHLTVVQVGSDQYLPIAPESFLLYTDEDTGEQVTVLDCKTDATESKAWKENFERTAKNTYSINDALMQLLSNPFFIIGLVIFLWGLQLLLLYNRMGK